MITSYNKFNESIKHFLKPKKEGDILKDLENSNMNDNEKFFKSIKFNAFDIVKDMLKGGYKPNPLLLIQCLMEGKPVVAKYMLLYSDIDPSVDDNQSIIQAAHNGYTDIVELLLKDERIDPTVNFNYPIVVAYDMNHFDIIELLLKDERVRRKLTRKQIKRYKSVI